MLLIKNGYIKPMVGNDIENGCILIGDDGKIAALKEEIIPDANTEVIDAKGKLVTPGCVEAHCHIGVHNTAMRWEGADYNEMSDPITPHMRAIDGINPIDESFDLAIKNGVTSACTGPGSANVLGGTFDLGPQFITGGTVDHVRTDEPDAGFGTCFQYPWVYLDLNHCYRSQKIAAKLRLFYIIDSR